MLKNRSRSFSVLASAVCSTLGSCFIVLSCGGTETDNPVAGGDVFDGTSPENFSPNSEGATPCVPVALEEEAMLPRLLGTSVVVPSPSGRVIAGGSSAAGLALIDVSDPESPVELSRGVVRGEIHQLLLASSGELWVLATEPPTVAGAGIPSATAIDPMLRLVRVDVSDPAHPLRIADATLEGDAWELRERDGEVWVLSGRRDESQRRGCSVSENLCGYRYYEALLLAGFRPNGAALEPIGQAELPFEQRAWWGSDGVVTEAGGLLHALSWDSAGALRTYVVPSPGDESVAGPVEVSGNELSVVRAGAGQARLDVYDLEAPAASLIRSTPLGQRTERASIYSLFAEQHLWLQAPYGETPPVGRVKASAELWDMTGATPVQLDLPRPFYSVLPIAGATRAGQTGEILAIGFTNDDSGGGDELTLLSIRDGVVTAIDAPELADVNLDNGVPAPAGVTGTGDGPAWLLLPLGPGQPIGLFSTLSTADMERRYTTAFVGVTQAERAPGAPVPIDAVTGVALVESSWRDRGVVTVLELSGATPSRRIDLSPQMRGLVPTATGVVTVATAPASECEQTGLDCAGYAPGVSVFDLAGEPRLVAALPFPELPLPFVADPNRLSVRWELYDPITHDIAQNDGAEQQPAALQLDDSRLAFVAEVYMSCDNQADCDALEITAVPVREANVAFGTPAPCPPANVDPNCDPTPPPNPTVYGTGQRQYFYVLDLAAAGGPAWEAWGVSRLDATAARTDRDSRFASPIATEGVLAATRLERRRSATDFNDGGTTRFFLDRFERSATGDIVALPPVNVPGYPVARLGGSSTLERWLSVEAAPGETGEARLHRMNVQSDGARIEQTLDLGGHFSAFRDMRSGAVRLGLVLLAPDDGCGTSELSAVRLGSNPADGSEPLAIASTLELPSDDWEIAATDGDLALLQRGFVYVLVRVAADGALSVVSSSAIDVNLANEQLIGTAVFGAAGSFGPRILDLSAAP